MKGTIKIFSRMLGTGYIIGDDGEKYFFYGADMESLPAAGERVSFSADENTSGGRPRASAIKPAE